MKCVSVIVPVYHVEQYLRRCVESVLNQTYQNIELILVDDGGDDECPKICDEYSNKDARVTCIHKQNEGQSMARKAGLSIATGEYIMYLDGDDWLELDAVQICVEAAWEKDADIVCFGYKRVYEKNIFETPLFDSAREFSGADVKTVHRRMVGMIGSELARVEEADRLVTMWGKLYTRERALDGIFVSEREVGSSEDAIYNLGAFERCGKCVYINQYLYNYRKNNESATTKKYREKLALQWEKLYEILENYIFDNELGNEYITALNNRIALGMLGLGLNELSSSKNLLGKAEALRNILNKQRWKKAFKQLEFKYFPFKWKIFYGLCKKKWTEFLVILLWIIQYLKSVIAS